ncbi:uncharacterized protein BO88DRAFT_455476 [Aspergillus vadensis CBS 113365]|uniref:Uncharacterized protein n=1 Tax=Aspergillus vadensis (strain CBS 113365 / IMI 142717 / IBT 24658) TaxID=1448311 RepID=A0A319BWE5_ASPVC|nr:hypothetical protein BO88DRAFT_455476 [Aspergillus vadensis CBS 113365]PYH67458.1 hypothetical protein BO88DRAFT_455476 [Aspergillus vadensis CBS 113365]
MALAKPGDLRGSAVLHDIVSYSLRDKRWKILVALKYTRIPYHESAVLDRKHAADPRVKMLAMKTRSLAFLLRTKARFLEEFTPGPIEPALILCLIYGVAQLCS